MSYNLHSFIGASSLIIHEFLAKHNTEDEVASEIEKIKISSKHFEEAIKKVRE